MMGFHASSLYSIQSLTASEFDQRMYRPTRSSFFQKGFFPDYFPFFSPNCPQQLRDYPISVIPRLKVAQPLFSGKAQDVHTPSPPRTRGPIFKNLRNTAIIRCLYVKMDSRLRENDARFHVDFCSGKVFT
jgi:hypothetical protein